MRHWAVAAAVSVVWAAATGKPSIIVSSANLPTPCTPEIRYVDDNSSPGYMAYCSSTHELWTSSDGARWALTAENIRRVDSPVSNSLVFQSKGGNVLHFTSLGEPPEPIPISQDQALTAESSGGVLTVNSPDISTVKFSDEEASVQIPGSCQPNFYSKNTDDEVKTIVCLMTDGSMVETSSNGILRTSPKSAVLDNTRGFSSGRAGFFAIDINGDAIILDAQLHLYRTTLPHSSSPKVVKITDRFWVQLTADNSLWVSNTESLMEAFGSNGEATIEFRQVSHDLELSDISHLEDGILLADRNGSKTAVSMNAGRTWTALETELHGMVSGRFGSAAIAKDGELWTSNFGYDWTPARIYADSLTCVDSCSTMVALVSGKLQWSLDWGKTWESIKVSGSSLIALDDNVVLVDASLVDFGTALMYRCNDWDAVEETSCTLGLKHQRLRRRRPHWYCSLEHVAPEREPCQCTASDYECAPGFLQIPNGTCVSNMHDTAVKSLPGSVRKIPESMCITNEVEIDSNEGGGDAVNSDDSNIDVQAAAPSLQSRRKEFPGTLGNYVYLKSDTSGDETVLAWTTKGDLWASHDQGTLWNIAQEIRDVLSVMPHPKNRNYVYVLTQERRIWASSDRGVSWKELKLPAPANLLLGKHTLGFHPSQEDWLVFHGTPDCRDSSFWDCPTTAYASKDRGLSWTSLLDNAEKCLFVGGLLQPTAPELIVCQQFGSDGSQKLLSSQTWSEQSSTWDLAFDQVYGVALNEPFLLAATAGSKGSSIDAQVSVNGVSWAHALFPPNVGVDSNSGYTVIGTETNSSFLFASTSTHVGHEFGVLLKSNYNGTNYVTTLDNVNRNEMGFVDYERVKSVEGVALANIVSNPAEAKSGAHKIIQSRITHSDGAFWDFIPPPKGSCPGDKATADCALHLHGYTERIDPRSSPSSPSAVGLIVAQGNVGDRLTDLRESSTYISRDGGVTFRKVGDGPAYWEFGDSGSIVVLLDADDPTNEIKYTQDEGATWSSFQFSDEVVKVVNLASIPSDTSRKFIVFAQPPAAQGDVTWAIQIDFSGLTRRPCTNSDFELWTPLHPQTGSECLFGHKAEYRRKRPDRTCFVGKIMQDGELGKPSRVLHNCKCTQDDYECDYNHVRGPDGKCQLLSGLQAPGKEEQCATGAVSWHHNTGYRRISISTCQGGLVLDDPREYACPGKEDEFNKQPHHTPNNGGGRSFLGTLVLVLFVIGLLICLAIVVSKFAGVRSGLGGGLGHIRLGGENTDASGVLNTVLHSSLDIIERVVDHARDLWALTASRLFAGHSQNNLGLYARMDDEERYRILESDFEEEDGSLGGSFHDDGDDANQDNDQEDHTLLNDDELGRQL